MYTHSTGNQSGLDTSINPEANFGVPLDPNKRHLVEVIAAACAELAPHEQVVRSQVVVPISGLVEPSAEPSNTAILGDKLDADQALADVYKIQDAA